jgi:hypothetical protein
MTRGPSRRAAPLSHGRPNERHAARRHDLNPLALIRRVADGYNSLGVRVDGAKSLSILKHLAKSQA